MRKKHMRPTEREQQKTKKREKDVNSYTQMSFRMVKWCRRVFICFLVFLFIGSIVKFSLNWIRENIEFHTTTTTTNVKMERERERERIEKKNQCLARFQFEVNHSSAIQNICSKMGHTFMAPMVSCVARVSWPCVQVLCRRSLWLIILYENQKKKKISFILSLLLQNLINCVNFYLHPTQNPIASAHTKKKKKKCVCSTRFNLKLYVL